MPVINYIYPELLTDSLKKVLDRTVFMLQIFSQRYGLYPFIKEKFGHAQFGWNGGMEHQTMTCLTSTSFNEDLVSHELSHQWFGDKITCRDWHHIWLNEGFATYSQAVYHEGAYGGQNYSDFMLAQMNRAKTASGSIYVQDISDESQIFNSARTYSKGAVVLHMLRGIVGDSAFFRILRTYASDPSLAYSNAVTEDFRRVAESVYGSSLDYFFSEWIYGENYPVYTINWNASNISGNQYYVVLKITQTTNSNPVYFTMPIQLKINTSSGDTLITIFNNQLIQKYSIVVNGKPAEVVFDPCNWILKDVSTGTDTIVIPESYKLYQNYPNPFNPSTLIKYSIPVFNQDILSPVEAEKTELVTLKIYDILGNEVAVLVNKEQTEGEYQVQFSPSKYGLASGIYLYELNAGGFIQSKKMVYLK
jgi:aminopeptidase N